MKEQFTNVKVGDQVWSINYGWGEVDAVTSHKFQAHFRGHAIIWVTLSGYEMRGPKVAQTIFWDEIHIDPPARPKREVIHEIERWVNVYDDDMQFIHHTKKSADSHQVTDASRIACVKLTGTYTTWEEG